MPHDVVSFFVCNIEKLITCCICAKKNYYNFAKNSQKVQARVTESCTSLSKSFGIFRESPSKEHLIFKKFYCTLTASQLFFLVSNEIFFYLFTVACLCHIRQANVEFVLIFVKSNSSRF